MYSKEELAELIIKNPEEYNSYKKTMGGELDLTELDFSNITLEEVDFSNTELAGTSFMLSEIIPAVLSGDASSPISNSHSKSVFWDKILFIAQLMYSC